GGIRSTWSSIRPSICGCRVSTPESITATVTPAPVACGQTWRGSSSRCAHGRSLSGGDGAHSASVPARTGSAVTCADAAGPLRVPAMASAAATDRANDRWIMLRTFVDVPFLRVTHGYYRPAMTRLSTMVTALVLSTGPTRRLRRAVTGMVDGTDRRRSY